MQLSAGQSAEITTAFIRIPGAVMRDPQRYTCIEEGRRCRYESRVGGFRRELDIDGDGLVVTHPDFWQSG